MDHKYRVEDHRIQAEELGRIAAAQDQLRAEIVANHATYKGHHQGHMDRHLRVIARLDALTALVEELAWRPEPRKKRWWWS